MEQHPLLENSAQIQQTQHIAMLHHVVDHPDIEIVRRDADVPGQAQGRVRAEQRRVNTIAGIQRDINIPPPRVLQGGAVQIGETIRSSRAMPCLMASRCREMICMLLP